MSTQPDTNAQGNTKDSSWAKPVTTLKTTGIPTEAININVDGRELTGPIRGFGQMWQKTYRVPIKGSRVNPKDLIKTWKDDFPSFWPKGNRFYGSVGGISPGDVAVLHMAGPGGLTGPGGIPAISTGIMVIYADEESFSFMTPQGHPMAGMITFSAATEEDVTIAQVQVLIRASDPMWEFIFRLGGLKEEDKFWELTLQSIAKHFGEDGKVETTVVRVDPRLQWSEAKNIWHNAAIRTFLYYLFAPFRWVRNLFRRQPKEEDDTP